VAGYFLFQFLSHFAPAFGGGFCVYDEAKGVKHVVVEENIEFYKVGLPVFGQFIVEGSVAAAAGL
jgi:hypothetical protein